MVAVKGEALVEAELGSAEDKEAVGAVAATDLARAQVAIVFAQAAVIKNRTSPGNRASRKPAPNVGQG